MKLVLALLLAIAGSACAGEIPARELPPEARHTLALIRAGGPFPYQKDGATFGNRA